MSAVIAVLPDLADVAGEDPQAGVGVNPANGEAIFLSPELGYTVLAFWLVVPLLIGYYRFNSADM